MAEVAIALALAGTAERGDYDRLVQDYEAEFAPLTGKQPDAHGRYALDTDLDRDAIGVVFRQAGQAI